MRQITVDLLLKFSKMNNFRRLHKPVTDWLETLPHSSDGLNM